MQQSQSLNLNLTLNHKQKKEKPFSNVRLRTENRNDFKKILDSLNSSKKFGSKLSNDDVLKEALSLLQKDKKAQSRLLLKNMSVEDEEKYVFNLYQEKNEKMSWNEFKKRLRKGEFNKFAKSLGLDW